MTVGEKQRLFARLISHFILALDTLSDKKWEVTFGQVYRTPEQQEIYIKQGLSKTKNSQHLLKLAADLNIFVDGEYVDGNTEQEKVYLRIAGEMWEEICKSAGAVPEWGGRFGVVTADYPTKVGWDANHFGIK